MGPYLESAPMTTPPSNSMATRVVPVETSLPSEVGFISGGSQEGEARLKPGKSFSTDMMGRSE